MKQRLATLKRLKGGDENEFERKLTQEKVVTIKELGLKSKTGEWCNYQMVQFGHVD